MIITKEQLIEKEACPEGLEWFGQEFGEEAELEALKKKIPHFTWLHWLFDQFELSGILEFQDPSDRFRACCQYKDGKRHGLHEIWHENGQMSNRCPYKDGKPNRLCESWYANGELEERCTYKDGLADGHHEWWDERGNLLGQRTYKNGEIVDDNN